MTTSIDITRPHGTPARLELVRGDITRFPAEAIVNAANAALAGGGGVDGAIHRAAGPELMAELHTRYSGCPTGSAVVTGAGRLSAGGVRHVIHAVGPRWRGGDHDEPALLASAYRRSIELAAEAGDATVALPAISAGIYGYPLDEAARIAVRTVAASLREAQGIDRATFVLYSEETLGAFLRALDELRSTS